MATQTAAVQKTLGIKSTDADNYRVAPLSGLTGRSFPKCRTALSLPLPCIWVSH